MKVHRTEITMYQYSIYAPKGYKFDVAQTMSIHNAIGEFVFGFKEKFIAFESDMGYEIDDEWFKRALSPYLVKVKS